MCESQTQKALIREGQAARNTVHWGLGLRVTSVGEVFIIHKGEQVVEQEKVQKRSEAEVDEKPRNKPMS